MKHIFELRMKDQIEERSYVSYIYIHLFILDWLDYCTAPDMNYVHACIHFATQTLFKAVIFGRGLVINMTVVYV